MSEETQETVGTAKRAGTTPQSQIEKQLPEWVKILKNLEKEGDEDTS
jgi:hypothetical protein